MGFNHSADTNSVMYPNSRQGPSSYRVLSQDDRRGIRDLDSQCAGCAYAPAIAVTSHSTSDNNGASWIAETESYAENQVGTAAVCSAPQGQHQLPRNCVDCGRLCCPPEYDYYSQFLVAVSEASASNNVVTWLTDETGSYKTPKVMHASSYLGPAVAYDGGSKYVLAYVDTDSAQTLKTSYSAVANAATWSTGSSVSQSTGLRRQCPTPSGKGGSC